MYTRYDKKEIKLQKNRMKEVDKKKTLISGRSYFLCN
jgi:hypothetical protein